MTMDLFVNRSGLFNIIEGPTTTKIMQWTKDKQLNRGHLLIVWLGPTPSIKQLIRLKLLHQLKILFVWEAEAVTECLLKFCIFVNVIILDVKMIPQWFLRRDNLQWSVLGILPSTNEGRVGGASNCTGRLREDVARGGNGELILAWIIIIESMMDRGELAISILCTMSL